MATDICLPFGKFSHAVGVQPNNTVTWTHLTAPDLFVMLVGNTVQSMRGDLSIRIVRGNMVLENIDVGAYVETSIQLRRTLEDTGITPQVEQLPIFGITQESLLALRYRLDDGQPRRIQLRMRNNAECHQVVSVLRNRGVQFAERRRQSARPPTSTAGNCISETRPLTVESTSPHFDQSKSSSRPETFGHPQQGIHSRAPSRNGPTESDGPAMASYGMPPPSSHAKNNGPVTRPTDAVNISTTSMYRSYTTPPCPVTSEAYLPSDSSHTMPLPPGTALHDLSSQSMLSSIRPQSSRSIGGSSKSRPSSALDLPPLPKPKFAKASVDSPATQLNASQRTRPKTNSSSATAFTSNENETAHFQARTDMAGNGTLEQLSLTEIPSNVVCQQPVGDSEREMLQVYASQNLSDRQTALDDFMVANLENSAFTTLCEDVENCWKRIALGL